MAENFSIESAALAASTATAKLNSDIVTQTLDAVNKTGSGKKGAQGGMSDTYNFSKQVLSAVYEGKGTIADSDG